MAKTPTPREQSSKELIPQKGCIVPSHNDGFICMFCVDKDCSHQSRSLCINCSIELDNNHINCENFLRFKNINNFDLQFLNKKEYNIQELYSNIISYEENLCQEIDKNYKKLQTSLQEKIKQIQLKCKKEVWSRYKSIKKIMEEYLEKETEFNDLKTIQEEVHSFKEGSMNIEELNEKLIIKQQQNTEKQTKSDMITTYNQVEQQQFYHQTIETLEQTLFTSLDQINVLECLDPKSEQNQPIQQNEEVKSEQNEEVKQEQKEEVKQEQNEEKQDEKVQEQEVEQPKEEVQIEEQKVEIEKEEEKGQNIEEKNEQVAEQKEKEEVPDGQQEELAKPESEKEEIAEQPKEVEQIEEKQS